MKTLSLINRRFGYLTVVDRAGFTRDKKRRRKARLWLCHCTCGETILARTDNLRAGRTKACAKNGHRWRPKTGLQMVQIAE